MCELLLLFRSKLRAIIILSVVVFIQCTDQNKFESIHGLWISSDYGRDKLFYSLLIEDSLVEVNKYGTYSYTCPLWPEKDFFQAYDPHWYKDFRLFKKGDTLVQIFSHREKIKYTRRDSLGIYKELLFSDSPLKITLPNANENTGWITLKHKYLTANLYIGRLKNGSASDFPNVAHDSVALQVYDVLIPVSEVRKYTYNEQQKLDELERKKLIIVLYADKETPEEMIQKIIKEVRQQDAGLVICKAFIDWDIRKIFYKEL